MDAKYEKALQKMQEMQDVARVELPSAAIGRAAYALIKTVLPLLLSWFCSDCMKKLLRSLAIHTQPRYVWR